MFTIIEKSNVKIPIKDKETGEIKGFMKSGGKFTLSDGVTVSYNQRHDSYKITRPPTIIRYRSLSPATDSRGKVLTNPAKSVTIKRKDLRKKLSEPFVNFILTNL